MQVFASSWHTPKMAIEPSVEGAEVRRWGRIWGWWVNRRKEDETTSVLCGPIEHPRHFRGRVCHVIQNHFPNCLPNAHHTTGIVIVSIDGSGFAKRKQQVFMAVNWNGSINHLLPPILKYQIDKICKSIQSRRREVQSKFGGVNGRWKSLGINVVLYLYVGTRQHNGKLNVKNK